MKPAQWVGLALGVGFVLYAVYTHLQYFHDVSFLGGILLIEIVIVCLWKYDQRFFALLMIAFVWAGMHVPFEDAWTGGRWVVLAAGALTGYVVWMKVPRSHFKSIHLIALFCVLAAFVSASVSPYTQMASFKALSLLLLFLYCSSGARLAALGREERFFKGLLLACEIVTFGTALCYFVLGESIWGNPNALGAAMSIGVFPVLLWGWLTADGPVLKTRRLAALLLCAYLVFFSMARAGMVSMILVTLIFCSCLRQYKLLVKVGGLAVFLVAMGGMVAPSSLNKTFSNFEDAVLYKGHKEEGMLASRKTPWEDSITSIQQHPWFGTGYGTSPTGEDPGLYFGRFASSAETVREHGSSYMTIAEWVGLLGVVPFLALLSLTAANVWRVCLWMRRTRNPLHYSIPLAMVLVTGFVHASFEDWLFAVGSYPCVYFWAFAFLLADLIPATAAAPVPAVLVRVARPPARFEAAVPNR
ncbi:MAG: O-antigen ligase family protein [Terriglobales bacterium]